MKRPGPTSTDHPTVDWFHYCDDIASAASRGHRFEAPPAPTSRSGFASPDGVATSTLIGNDAQCEPADADPRLLPSPTDPTSTPTPPTSAHG